MLYRMGDKRIPTTNSFTHLGQEWTAGRKSPNIALRIKLARNTIYALLGAGLHGHNGLNPRASIKVISTYVLPRLLYGLEATVVSKGEIDQMETFYRGLLRTVQGLPVKVANQSVYLLLGSIPLEGQLYIRCLTLYGSITRMRGHTIHSLAIRQLAIKDSSSRSWLDRIADIYGLDLHAALTAPWPKLTWKHHVKNTVITHWHHRLLTSAVDKSSLSMLSHQSLNPGTCHPVWETCPNSVYQITAATVRARLITGRYPVQALCVRFNQNAVDPTCQLCGRQPETIPHMLIMCLALASVRQAYISRISEILHSTSAAVPSSETEWCKLVLDGGATHMNICSTKKSQTCSNYIISINILSSIMCHKLDTQRQLILNTLD